MKGTLESLVRIRLKRYLISFAFLHFRLQLSLDFRFDEIQILLHDGYDWSTTRKTIEAEIKAIRRRLQKLRQILASGQTPDESVEVTRTWLYESILIGLPEEELGDDAEALLAAIDNQLETLDADTASIAPSGPATSRRGDSTRSSPRPARRRRKLERSTRPQIEIKLAGFEVSHRVAVAGVRDRAKTSIASVNMEILDHIKTSTWKKFLAPMALAQGQVAETDVKMVQVQLTKVIAEEHGKQQEEYRLKVCLTHKPPIWTVLIVVLFSSNRRWKSSHCDYISTKTPLTS